MSQKYFNQFSLIDYIGPVGKVFDATIGKSSKYIPKSVALPLSAVVFLGIFIISSVLSPVSTYGNIPQRLQSIAGMLFMLSILYVFSNV